MTTDDEIVRGNQARMLLQDKLYIEAWDTVEQRLVSLLRRVDIDADKERRVLYALKGLAQARGYVENVMASGKLAAAQIERDKTFTERMRDKVRAVA